MTERTPDRLPVAVRAWTEVIPGSRDTRATGKRATSHRRDADREPPLGTAGKGAHRWRRSVLMVDTETTVDAVQRLNFGIYRYARWANDGTLTTLEEGILYADDLPQRDPDGFAGLQAIAEQEPADVAPDPEARRTLRLLSRREFIDAVLWPAIQADALIANFNLPFDLSRLVVKVSSARGAFEGGFSCTLWDYFDEERGEWREHKYRPRLRIKQIDAKRALFGLSGAREVSDPLPRPGFLDLRTLAFALSDRGHSLLSAGQAFDATILKASPTGGHGRITPAYVGYARRDVAATASLLEALRAEFDRHPIDLDPCWTLSPASIAKAYLNAMGLIPILERQPHFPPQVLGWAMSAYYGGRAETATRRIPVPVVYTDVLSMYPTVNALLGLWSWHIAERLEVEDCTAEAQALLDTMTPETVLDPQTWPRLTFFAELKPDHDIVPVRAAYAEEGHALNIGVNVFSDELTHWYAGPDLAASALLAGKPPTLERAVRIVPVGQQAGLRPVALRGDILVDPAKTDFFRTVIEERQRLKQRADLADEERERLDKALKVVANSGAYGITVESLPKQLTAGTTVPVLVYGPEETPFTARTNRPEKPGHFSFPPAAALVTAGARLILALIERLLADLGGSYAFCDTDSMAIVATESGGLVPCPGGSHRLADGKEAILALSWEHVAALIERLAALNPYDRSVVPDSILKIEKINVDPETTQRRQLWCVSIAAKRYALFYYGDAGNPVIPPSGHTRHGLGYLLDPGDPEEPEDADMDEQDSARVRWERALWESIVHECLGLESKPPPWEERPAVMRVTISSPWYLAPFRRFNAGKSYTEQIKPFNFLLAVRLADLGRPTEVAPGAPFRLVAPFETDPRKWTKQPWTDIYAGKSYRVTTRWPGGGAGEAGVVSLNGIAEAYPYHPEAKRAGANGRPCGKQTVGVLQRRVVHGAGTMCIGKEAHRLEDRGLVADLDELLTTYADPRRDPWAVEVLPRLRSIAAEPSGRDQLMTSGLSERALRNVLAGRSRPRKRAMSDLARLVNGQLPQENPQRMRRPLTSSI